MKYAIFIFTLFSLCACSDTPGARKVLFEAGYTDIEITGYSWFSCGKDDGWSTGFKAIGPTGQHVTGAVCSGLLKGSTIRLY